jgi:type I restriction enzyme S subunit
MSAFVTRPLIDLCDPSRGITYGIVKVGEFVSDGVPVIRGGDIRDGRISFDDTKKVSREVSNQFRRTILKGGEIVINLIAEPGHCAIVPTELVGANVSRDVAVIALGQDVDHEYVDYALKSPQAITWLTARLLGSVTQKINLGTLRELPIPCPALVEQRAIAAIVGALDRKIDLHRRMNETCASMAQAIFKDWFVDFGPVLTKAEAGPAYLRPDIWKLFPDRLDSAGKPAGWTEVPLDQIAVFLNGLALQKYPPSGDADLPVIKIAQLRSGHSKDADRASTEIPASYVVEDGDILFSWSGSLLHRVWTGGPGALNQHLFKVTSAKYPKWLLFHWVGHHLPEFQAIASSKATTMGHIQRHHLTAAKAMIPDSNILSVADQMIRPLFDLAFKNDLQNRDLIALRDLLLPKLMSGEIRVRDAEKVVEAVA